MHARLVALVLLLSLAVAPARATWYQENVPAGCDIVMMDLRWPWWPSGTYYANWNTNFTGAPNSMSFYAGILGFAPDGPDAKPNLDETIQDAFRPGSVWSFWGGDAAGSPVEFVDCAPNLFIKNVYGAEGASGSLGAEGFDFMKSKRWYTMLGRVWRPVDRDATHSYVARWIKDQEAGRWHLVGIARLPAPVTAFGPNAGFIETLSDGRTVRPLHRRFGYCRKEGTWLASDTITINDTPYVVVNVVPEGGHEYAAMEYASQSDYLPFALEGKPLTKDDRHDFRVKQPDAPSLDRPAVANVRAAAAGGQVAVSWQVPETASPAFAYRAEVFTDDRCAGAPLAVKEERMPTARLALLDAEAPREAVVRLTLTDVFDQRTEPVVVPVRAAPAPAAATTAAKTLPGLAYELRHKDSTRRLAYFHSPVLKPDEQHRWVDLAEIADGTLVRRGLARGFDLGVCEQRSAGYALVFTGLLRVPRPGFYVLRAQIDGAYRIRIDGKVALEWDGQHGTTERAVVRTLSAGDHALEVEHVYDQLPARNFRIDWEGPGIPRQSIPLEALRVADDGGYPAPTVTAEAGGDGTGRVTVRVDPRGHAIDRTALFLGHLQLAEAAGGALAYAGPLPRGAVSLWARVTFDGNHTVDSVPQTLEVTGRPVDPDWTVRNVGDAKASAGVWQTKPGGFLFFGNGMHTVTRRMEGDFTATCRIDGYNGSKGEPVNRRAWVGLTARERGDQLNWGWGRDFHLVQTAAEGLRASADFSDLGSGRLSTYALPAGRPWIRIVRQGQVWTGWTSADGRTWELGAYQWRPGGPGMDVGLFFSALPQDSRAHYHATVTELSVVKGVLPGSTPPEPAVARNTAGDRITGVAIARTDADVVVVRSTHAGLLRSADGGSTWQPANGDLRGRDLAVRSVAIHPADPRTMLRAGGGGLWKTTDGGSAWKRLALDGDFDGSGPSALCGEVVAYDLRNPDKVFAGCESRGFFASADGGESWTRLGLEGERVTAVGIWQWESLYPALADGRTELCVTTCPDRWMRFLGRGKPVTATPATESRTYVSGDGVKSLHVLDIRTDTGFHNVAWDRSLQSTREISYATTHGYEHNSGGHMSLFPPQKNFEWLRPFTCLATAGKGRGREGRFLTQALDPEQPGRLTDGRGGYGMGWGWLDQKGDVPAGGLIQAAGEQANGKVWWFVHTDGLYGSTDGGTTVRRVLDPSGRP